MADFVFKKEGGLIMMPRSKKVSLIAVLFLTAIIFTACGGSTSQDEQGVDLGLSAGELPINLQQSDSGVFSGKVVVKFKDGTDVRLSQEPASTGPFKSLSNVDVGRVNSLIINSSSIVGRELQIANIRRTSPVSEQDVDSWRNYWANQNVQTQDWNLAYFIDVASEEDAREIVNKLGDDDSVEYAEVLPTFYPASVTTPDVSDEQGYLKSAAEGGLGIEEAWAKLDARFPGKNIRGQGSMVVDHELDWNFNHEILPIRETADYVFGFGTWMNLGTDAGKNIPANIHHGAAVVGIIAGQGNDINKGIKGIVPSTAMKVITVVGSTAVTSYYADTSYNGVSIGDISTIEVQQKGVTTVASGCSVSDGVSGTTVAGCVPLESSLYLYQAIKDASNTGAIVVEGAGNGTVDLNDDNQAAPSDGIAKYSYFTQTANDSGSIVVGASLGADRRKASWSNCGDRVDLFAWGAGVVTAGYGDKFNPDNVDTNTLAGADNPKLYTGQFGGTSAATAQISGVAALLQSYVRALFDEAGFVGKTIYLDGRQLRQILKASGQPAVYGQTPNDPNPNCHIGVQPDASLAIDKTDDFLNAGNIIKIAPLKESVVSGIRYDMDGDGKADIISFSRDNKFYVDLSGNDFGSWDLELSFPVFDSDAMLFPVVGDYNSDGRADLAIYDSVNGKWYIKYTSSLTLSMSKGETADWDRVIDYSGDPNWKAYSRPLIGDFTAITGVDRFLDVSLFTPDGDWLIDYGGFNGVKLVNGQVQYLDKFGSFEKSAKVIADIQAPAWAWLPVIGDDNFSDLKKLLLLAPDGITVAKNAVIAYPKTDGTIALSGFYRDFSAVGGNINDNYLTIGGIISGAESVGFKQQNGVWNYMNYFNNWKASPFIASSQDFGDLTCRPITADYDGDGHDDLAVQCGNVWKIAYSSDVSGQLTEITLDSAMDPLPATVYAGGVKYQDILGMFNYYKTQLPCKDGSNCNSSSTINDVVPPIGPRFAECVKYWSLPPNSCWTK